MSFTNSNTQKFNHPHIDLISEDGELNIQVTTRGDIQNKIKSTLVDIRDSSNSEAKKIERVMFLVLHNDKMKDIVSYKEKKQIGNIPFDRDKDILTTKDIVKMATNDFEIQEKIYQLILKDRENIDYNSEKLYKAINRYKKIEQDYIECLINNEYEINRSELVNEINACTSQFIAVIGGPGVGKSLICRKVTELNENVVFARVERFLEIREIDSIWGFNIEETFKRLGNKKLIIFIDALEFISDNLEKTKILHELYSKVKNYGNVKLIVSCRTSDFNSFRRIIEFFEIKIFEVSEIDNREISKISEQFPVIASMNSLGKYKELLKTPLYIDIIVKQAENIDKIENESQLRDYIWSNIITLRGKTQRYNLKHNNVVEVIEKIVFDRAKRFLLGSNIKQYDSKIVDALLSENVIIKNRETIRLKLDLFEDIVFERFFDEKFEECKGDFNLFFKNIGEMGRSGFRRYQIWVSNKLLVKENRK